MSLIATYRTGAEGYLTELSRGLNDLDWLAFAAPVDWTGLCLAVRNDLTVDFTEHRARYIAEPYNRPDPGTPPDADVVLATVASCEAWADTAEGTDAWEGYRHALWVQEQLTQATPRAGIAEALGVV